MIGGPPMMMSAPPQFAPNYAVPPQQQYAPQGQPQQPPPFAVPPLPVQATPQPAPPASGLVQQTAPPRPIVRMQSEEEPTAAPPPPPVSLPAPDQLGVRCGLDWGSVHARLERLGATCFHEEKMASGGCHITCLLATSRPGLTHRIEAQGATAEEAAGLVLSEAEKWAAGK